MKVSKFTLVLFVFLFSCSSRASSSKGDLEQESTLQKVEEDALPSINGMPISDLPIVDPNLKEAWKEGERLLAILPPVLSIDANAEDCAIWFTKFLDWTRLFFANRHALINKIGELQFSPRVTLFSNLLFANMDARFIDRLEKIKLPSTLSERSFSYVQNTIYLKISVLIEATISEFQVSKEGLNSAHLSLEVWKPICEKEQRRFLKQRKKYDRKALHKKTKYKQSLSDKWPTECQTKGVPTYSQYEGRRNLSSKTQRIALLIDEDDFKNIFKDDPAAFSTFRKTLYKAVARLTKKAKLIPLREIDRAKALVLEKRLSKRSNVCAAAPPLEAVLQNKYKNLVIAKVTQTRILGLCSNWNEKKQKIIRDKTCTQDEKVELSVRLNAYGARKNFESISNQGNVKPKERQIPQAWIDAAKTIPTENKNKLGALLGNLVSGIRGIEIQKRFYDKGYQNPWFEKTKTLNTKVAFHACNTSASPISYDLDWSITPDGKSEDVKLTWIREPEKDSKEAQTCMEKVLRETAWRCPGSGKTTKQSSRVCEKKSYQWWD